VDADKVLALLALKSEAGKDVWAVGTERRVGEVWGSGLSSFEKREVIFRWLTPLMFWEARRRKLRLRTYFGLGELNTARRGARTPDAG
jgi:hypothetical protein